MSIRGAHVFLRMLADAGVRYLFGNPGTTELPLMDALVDEPRIRYILGLQEVPVMAMADGYAMASRHVGVVNLHTACGLGHAMGILYNAYREGTPLLVTAGQQDRRLKFEEPILAGDMVSVARPWTKWAAEVDRVEDLPSAVRRALQCALAPPTGPVFLSIPIDVQSEVAPALDTTPASPLDHRVRPPADALRRAAEVLAAAANPAILAGGRVVEAGASDALGRLAERLGAVVIAEPGTSHGRLPLRSDHPLAALGLPLWSPEVRARLAEYDVLLVVGMDLLRLYVYYEPARPIPEHIRLVHLDTDPWQMNKNYPVEVGLIGELGTALGELDALLAQRQRAEQADAARQRVKAQAEAHRRQADALRERAARERAASPGQVSVTPLALMAALARVLPEDVAVVEEAVTTTGTYLERLGALRNATGYFGHRGWALGWGLGCAIGAKLAWPERPVLALLGDGAAMYGIQGLWTAAHERIPVTFVICNNAQYQILKVGARSMGLPHARQGEFVGLDITQPEIDYVALARSLGVAAVRLTDADAVAEAVAEAFRAGEPRLIDVPIGRELPDRLNYG
jgi:benzoylformate decarboxylase